MNEETTISEIGSWDPSRHFDLEEAVKLIYRVVVNRPEKEGEAIKNIPIELLGLVSGVLTLNDNIEVVVKLYDGVYQFTKPEFEEKFMIVEDD